MPRPAAAADVEMSGGGGGSLPADGGCYVTGNGGNRCLIV